MARPKTVYRGKRKYRWLITAILFVVVLLIMAGVWLFYYLQRFIVYDKDGLSLSLPFMSSETPAGSADLPDSSMPSFEGVDAEIVIDTPDFSELDTGAGEGLSAIRAQYVPAENVTAANLTFYGSALAESGADSLLLQVKTPQGTLSYLSGVELAASYGVNGTEDITVAVASLKEQGVYLAAEMSCLVDDAMAVRNSPLALRDGDSGAVLTDGSGAWLDPYNKTVRAYLADIITELAGLGFDEIVLTGLAYPDAGNVSYSQPMTAAPDAVSCVSSIAKYLRETADALGVRLSVSVNSEKLRLGESAAAGQDLSFFLKTFDRIYVETNRDYLTADLGVLRDVPGGENSARIVPLVTGYTPETDSWAVK